MDIDDKTITPNVIINDDYFIELKLIYLCLYNNKLYN